MGCSKSKNSVKSPTKVEPIDQAETIESARQRFEMEKPWLSAIVPPTNPPRFIPNEPAERLVAEYVYGYKAQDSRNNLFYTANSQRIVYYTASIGVVLNKTLNTQRLLGAGDSQKYRAHTNSITAIAINHDRSIVATGQCGKDPLIIVWNTAECSIIKKFSQGENTRLVKGLAFSKCGLYLCSISSDDNHSIFVWDISTEQAIYTESNDTDSIADCGASKTEDKCFGFAGKRGIKFLSLDSGMQKGLFSGHEMKDFCTIAFLDNGDAATGTTTGEIYIWSNNTCKKSMKGHKYIVCAIGGYKEWCLTGSKDKINVYDTNWNLVREIPVSSTVRALDMNSDGLILAGFRDGTIAEIDSANKFNSLMKSHSDGEVWGLAVEASTGKVVTTGDDNKILIWDPSIKKCVGEAIINTATGARNQSPGLSAPSNYTLNQQARAVSINSINGQVALGLNNGEFQVRKSLEKINSKVTTRNDTRERIEVIHFSPNGEYCAVGSYDNSIYVYKTKDYSLVSKCVQHNAFITAFDWSLDSSIIHSVCGAHELLFFDAKTGQQIPNGATTYRDERWARWSIKLGWPVQGIFPPQAKDASYIHGVARNSDDTLLATADEEGLVSIFRWPCLERSRARTYCLHSPSVARVDFASDDSKLFSVGGFDQTFAQWKVSKAGN